MYFDISTILGTLIFTNLYRLMDYGLENCFALANYKVTRGEAFFITFWVGGLRLQFKDRIHTNGVLYTKLLAQA